MNILITTYLVIMALTMFFSIPIFLDKEDPKLGARVLLCAPVWPIALVVLLIMGICKLFVMAEWVHKKRELVSKPLSHGQQYSPTTNAEAINQMESYYSPDE